MRQETLVQFFAVLVCCTASTERTALDQHLKRVLDFRCGPPQPRAVPVASLVPLPSDVTFLPMETVLHRCESSGCCHQTDYSCAAAAVKEVELFIRTKRAVNSTAKSKVVSFMATNHTACSCQSMSVLPK